MSGKYDQSPPPEAGRIAPKPGRLNLGHLAQGLKIAALLLFLLPWVTISCAEQTLVQLSGLDLARGSASLINPITGERVTPSNDGRGDIAIQLAALLIVSALGAGFALRKRIASLVTMSLLTFAAVLIAHTILYRLPNQARDKATEGSVQGISEAQIANLIRFEVEPGFWLVLAALAATILLAWMSWRRAPPEP